VLKEEQLAFVPLEWHHTRANIASIIASVLNEYEISGKVGFRFIPYTDADVLTPCSQDGSQPTMWPITIWHSKL